jgi:hypothetical protein
VSWPAEARRAWWEGLTEEERERRRAARAAGLRAAFSAGRVRRGPPSYNAVVAAALAVRTMPPTARRARVEPMLRARGLAKAPGPTISS